MIEMSDTESRDMEVKRYRKRTLTSFQLGNLVGLMFSQIYGQQLTYYYTSYIGLNLTYFLIAQIIFMVYNMFNDPFLGHLSDKSSRFTKRWGKRFPFIMIGAIPWAIIPLFLYTAPSVVLVGQLGVFLWFLIVQSINDTAFSLMDVNRVGLFPDKFRDERDRKIGGTITTVLETIGILLGVLIPVLTIDELGPDLGYPFQALLATGLALTFVMLMIPGVREDKEMKERRARLDETVEREPFFRGMKTTLKDKNFIGYMALYTGYTTTMGIVMASIPFFVQDILLLPKLGELVMLAYIFAVIGSAYLWYKLSYRLGIKKVALIGAVLLGLMGLPIIGVPSGPTGLTFVIIIFIIAGFVDGAIISMTMPLFSSIIDNATVKSGRRKEGIYQGTHVFFSRFGIAINAFVFWLVNLLTGYESGATSELALFGLRFQISVFPLIIIFSGAFIFWRLYKLREEDIKENAIKLKELDL
jgi:GPH family glycoside/pentoside/hexuronide:cation symporter